MTADYNEWLAASFLVVLSVASAASYRRDHSRQSYKDGSRERMPSPGAFVWVYAYIRYTTLLCGVGALLWRHEVWLVVYRSPVAIYVGMALAVIGFGLFEASRRALGRHYSPCFESYVPAAIVTTGPYAFVRHPIYTANQLVLVGVTLFTGSIWIAVNLLLLSFYYTRSALAEERRLADEHHEYGAYRKQTGRFLPRFGRRPASGVWHG